MAENLNNADETVPRKICSIAANLPNTQPFWRERKHELDAMTFFHLKEYGDMPAYFDTMSCAEYHCVPLLELLIKYYAAINSEQENSVKEKLLGDSKFKRQLVLQNLHIVTAYFDTRTINYYASVLKEAFQYDDVWWRNEFAKSRGEIHSHAIIFSKKHALKIKSALENQSGINPSEELRKWLQTTELDNKEQNLYSPGFVSMHPAGGSEQYSVTGERQWLPDKSMWAAPEGTQVPPEVNPLSRSVSDLQNDGHDLHAQHVYLVNRIGLHNCSGYCLRLKRK